jgi:hypothetical protein
MNRLQAWLLHISTIVLTITGVVYAYMHYMMKPSDPFSVVNHPAEPYLIDIHILAAPLLVLMVGVILHSHILFKLQGGARIARKSGIFLIPLFAVMVISGYLLQVVNGNPRKIFVTVHLISGFLWFVSYAGHHIASYKVRALQRQNSRIEDRAGQRAATINSHQRAAEQKNAHPENASLH